MSNNSIEDIIINLINSKKEGDFWNFKEEPHENRASLLHDILCLANSQHKGNRFLIYGVTDPKPGAIIRGLSSVHKNRKTQVQFIDFLSSVKFAGDCRPEIELHTIQIENVDIDVLIIYDNPQKPYYLTENYSHKLENDKEKGVLANHIYTRINDKNTPINKSADIGIIEKMWKQRFGIDISPLERMKLLLKEPKNWFKDVGNKSYAYHLEFPEFRIEFSEVEEFHEVYSFFFTNPKSYLGKAKFLYHSTTLFELEYMYCDEMRIELAVPKAENIRINKSKNWYYYYSLDELNGIFLYFMTNGLKHLHLRGSAFPFVLFDKKDQIESFNEFVKNNNETIANIKPSFHAENAIKEIERKNDYNPVIDPIFVDRMVSMYEQYKYSQL